ncbi:hypothetical protein QBC32DRAFT_214924 [Pseudoneurospora amorphoporcata]|uniref:Uncharacterized protein n=1 Tax=Pseudoneurospora amorphoporcata TaxID=241081 RepID=A0AAN6NV01_9PEZI|nr:hypothetical protein QBC32DRAFT_214924 [Pseudoneurospora amorphoporcata]
MQFAAWGNICPAKPASRAIPCGFRRLQTVHPATTPLPVLQNPPPQPCGNPAKPCHLPSRDPASPKQRIRRLKGLRSKEASMGVMVGDFGNSQNLHGAAGHGDI